MSQFSSSKPIAEGDVAATLRLVLNVIVKQNKVCTALVDFDIRDLGTAGAKVVLVFDDAQCVKPELPPPKAG